MADSALDLVRSLKGPADPPTPGGLSKIDLAQQGWSNSALYMPNKAETILEWLLTRLLKDKVRDPTANPMLNFKYWSLLNEVLTSVIPAASNPLNNPARLWLVPLVNRVPIVPVLTTLLHLFSVDSYVAEEPLLSLALRSFYALWPYAAPKITLDSLLDCCGALFGYLAASSYKLLLQQTDLKSDLSKLALTVYTSYKESLGNAAHKKKICATFIQQHLRHWLDCVSSRKGTLESDETLTATFEVGVETLFNVDVLRVAHEQRVHTSLDETLGVLIVQAPETVLASIPYLFKSYIEVNKKFRNALFGQGSKNIGVTAAEQARGASIKFFATCDSLSRSVTESEAVWRTRLALLSIVNEEDLVVAGDQESMDILQPIGDLAVTSLAAASQVQDSSLTQMILDTLSILVHIDYDLVPGALTRVLPLISMSLDILPHALPYLGKVLSFHTKTRTVDVFTDACLTFLTGQSTVTHHPRIIYEISSSSAIFNHSFLDQLSKAIHGFLTPNQVPELTRSILGYLQTRIEDFEESISRASQNDDSSRKKRKRDKQTTPIDPDQAALVFALTAKIAVIALTSLPLQIVLDDVQQSVKQDIQEFYDGVVRRILKVAPKACLNDTNNVWGWQIVTSSILKFSYHLLDSQLVTDDENSSSPKLFKVLKAPEILPELRVEIYRVLLQEANSGRFSATDIVEEIFQEIQQTSATNSAAWNGELHCLNANGQTSTVSVAGLLLLLDRWLPMLDTLATPKQLRFVVELMLDVTSTGNITTSPQTDAAGLTMHSIFSKTLRNAEFWELPKFRNAFVSLLDERTSSLDGLDIHKCLSHHSEPKTSKPPTQEELSIQAVYDILLYAPVEYLPRNVRTDLLRRAMVVDVSIGKSVRDVPLHPDQQKRLVSLRAFIRRAFAHIGVVEHNAMIGYTDYLMGPSSLPVDNIPFNRVTLDLIELHLRSLLSFAEKGDETDLVELIKIFTTGFEFVDSRMINGLPERSLVLFIDMVLSKYRTSDLKANIVDALGNMEMTVYPLFYERLTHLESKIRGPPSHKLMEMEDSLNVWHRLLLLRSWLSRKGFSKMFLGQKLARQFLDEVSSTSNSSGVANAILSICLVEIHFINERAEQLQFVVAIYLAFRLKCRDALGNNRLDDGFSIACKKLSVQDFSDVLDLVIDGLAKQGLERTSLCDLIHLSGILVHDAPEGTLKITQEHVNRALNIFVNCSQYTIDTELIRHVVEFVAKYFNDRPAAIKSSHVSLTWALLGSCLAGASSHEEQTNRQIYQDVVSILSTLIRLRRDLILPSLPLLCVMLSRLIVCLKSMFPNLGARQSNLVSSTLPQWISPHKPLGNDESKALARLFTTLTTKTIIRTHNTSTTDTQKADSLARPLSKHISVVLKAYVDTLTDPLCILPSEMRRELEPGLFALCEIIGEQYRDAMMVTLDTAGKAVMKGLWREYEKQRYVGKG